MSSKDVPMVQVPTVEPLPAENVLWANAVLAAARRSVLCVRIEGRNAAMAGMVGHSWLGSVCVGVPVPCSERSGIPHIVEPCTEDRHNPFPLSITTTFSHLLRANHARESRHRRGPRPGA